MDINVVASVTAIPGKTMPPGEWSRAKDGRKNQPIRSIIDSRAEFVINHPLMSPLADIDENWECCKMSRFG